MGASGDLAPLSHLALGMMGEGLMWSPKTGWGQAKDILVAHNLIPITLAPKEVMVVASSFCTIAGSFCKNTQILSHANPIGSVYS